MAENTRTLIAMVFADATSGRFEEQLWHEVDQVASRVLGEEDEQHRFNLRVPEFVARLSRTGEVIGVELEGSAERVERLRTVCGVMQRMSLTIGDDPTPVLNRHVPPDEPS